MRKTQSPILDAVHDTAKGLHKAGVSTVQKWEIGQKKPTGTALNECAQRAAKLPPQGGPPKTEAINTRRVDPLR